MMPLMFANPGDEVTIKKVGGSAETKKSTWKIWALWLAEHLRW